MIDLPEILRQLSDNAAAVRALVGGISAEQAQWKPDPQTWSMQQVMEHVYNEERGDFRCHIQEILSTPPQTWGKLVPPFSPAPDFQKALRDFLSEREASLSWLKSLNSPNWDAEIQTPFAPNGKKLVLSAGDVLLSWVAHDYLHLRQMIELQYAWIARVAAPKSVDYAGDW